jgi:tripartite-type tricarboxylate transporter receptor subunit TctC
MKKILSALLFLTVAFSASAKETITIFYAWGPGDSVANYSRTLADEANKIQDKYTFVFDTKPGAGGAIASNHVLKTPNTILAHSTAFFVRPVVFPNESYDVTQFKDLMTQCMAPMSITSSKYKYWSEVPTDKPLTVGTSGLGVTTHLAAIQLQKKFPNIDVIPFKATSESILSMVGGQTDFHVGFLSEAESWAKDTSKNNGRVVHVLGITGTKSINGYPLLSNEGFPKVFDQMNVGFHLVVPTSLDKDKAKELNSILAKAAKAESVRNAYAIDYCAPLETPYANLPKFFDFHTEHWKKLSSGIKVN